MYLNTNNSMPTGENPRTIRRQYEYSISKSILTEIYITKSFTQKKLYLLINESPEGTLVD